MAEEKSTRNRCPPNKSQESCGPSEGQKEPKRSFFSFKMFGAGNDSFL
jgi:hypothetical protein